MFGGVVSEAARLMAERAAPRISRDHGAMDVVHIGLYFGSIHRFTIQIQRDEVLVQTRVATRLGGVAVAVVAGD